MSENIMPPKANPKKDSAPKNSAPTSVPQAGLYARPTTGVTNRYGRVTGTTRFTQEPAPNADYYSENDDDFDERDAEEETEFVEGGDGDPFVARDTEGYSLTYGGQRDPDGRDVNGWTRAQNAQHARTYGFDAEGYDANGFDPHGFSRLDNEQHALSQVHRFNAEGYDADGLDVEGRSKAENTEISHRVLEEAAARNAYRLGHGSLRPPSDLGPQPRNSVARRSRDAVPREPHNSTQRQLFGLEHTGPGDRGVPGTVVPRPRNADPLVEDPLVASDIRTRLQASVALAGECERQARAIRERFATPGNRPDSDNRHNGLLNRLRGYEEQLAAADATTARLSAQLGALTRSGDRRSLATAPRPKRAWAADWADDAPGGTGRGNANHDAHSGRLAAWAGSDPTGTAQRLLERHYRPHRDDDALSISSDGDSQSRTTRGRPVLPPVPESRSQYLNRYTQPAQQKAMHAKANAPYKEVAAICRSENGMHYGVHAQHAEVVRFLLNPDAFTAGVIQLRERCLALVNAEARLYQRIRLHASRMVFDDPTTWDFPFEEIEQLHRFYSDLLACYVVHQRRMNPGENPPLSIALVFAILTSNPINWAALAKGNDPLKTNTWLHERTGQDAWRAFDAWTTTDVVVVAQRDAHPPGGRAGGGGGGGDGVPRRPRAERRDERRDRSPPPTKPVSAAPATPGTPATDTPRPNSRPPLVPGQCANCLALNAGHSGRDCPLPCRKGGCRDAAAHPRNTCTK